MSAHNNVRPMTSEEIRKALRHGAQVCIAGEYRDWDAICVLRADGAYNAARDWLDLAADYIGIATTPLHAAIFLDLVAEAHE